MPLHNYLGLFLQPEVQANLLAAALTGLFGIATRVLAPQARIIWGTSHQFCFGVPQHQTGQKLLLYTRTVNIRSVGLAPCDGVEVHFSFKPEHLQVWPTYTYSEQANPEGQHIVRFENIGRGEAVALELLQSTIEPPLILRVRSREREWRAVTMATSRQFPRLVNIGVLVLLLLGVFTILSFLIKIALRIV